MKTLVRVCLSAVGRFVTQPRSQPLGAIAITAVLFLISAIVCPRFVAAQVSESDVVSDSDIELVEQAEAGSYQQYRIKITTRGGKSIVATNKDGVKTTSEMSSNQNLGLWRNVLGHGLEKLATPSMKADDSLGPVFPDQSQFTVRYRVGRTAGAFSVAGVDSLSDDRYRKIVRAILVLGDKYSQTRGR